MDKFFDTASIKDEYDVVIVGGGPAGVSAAIYTARDLLSTLVLEMMNPGGQIATTDCVENIAGVDWDISGMALSEHYYKQVSRFGADFRYGRCTDIQFDGDYKLVFIEGRGAPVRAKVVIGATGCAVRKLGVNGEDKFWGRGVSVCATCDAAFYKDKVVAAIGGGDSVLDESQLLAKYASKVYIVHRRESFRGSKIALESAKNNPKIEFILNSVVEEIIGSDKVHSIRLKNVHSNEVSSLNVDGVFLFIGRVATAEPFNKFLDVDNTGFLKVDDTTITSAKGIFIAGDVRSKRVRQVATAMADGVIAAKHAIEYIDEAQR